MTDQTAFDYAFVGAIFFVLGTVIQMVLALLNRVGRGQRVDSWGWAIGWGVLFAAALCTLVSARHFA